MKQNIYFFTELKSEKISIEIPNLFFEKGLCVVEGTYIKFNVSGLLVGDQNIFIIFPKGVFVKRNKEKNIFIAQTLLQVLVKYDKESIEKLQVFHGEHNMDSNFLSIINWLVKDYYINGIIKTNFISEKVNGYGRTDWNKTIRKTNPIIIQENTLYLDTINIKPMNNLNSNLTLVHLKILKEIETDFGWLLNFNVKIPPTIANRKINYNYRNMKYILHNSLRMTFNQKEIKLYQMLIKYIDSKITAQGRNSFTLLYTKYFQYVWEAICKRIFNDEPTLNYLLPKPYWKVDNNIHVTRQIPDILTTDESNNLYIIDAKYYRTYDGIKHLPGWNDMVKQFFYGQSIETQKFNNIYNIFIFPTASGDANIPISYHGKASIQGLEQLYGEIHSYTLNTSEAMNLYQNNDQGNAKELLINNLLTN